MLHIGAFVFFNAAFIQLVSISLSHSFPDPIHALSREHGESPCRYICTFSASFYVQTFLAINIVSIRLFCLNVYLELSNALDNARK